MCIIPALYICIVSMLDRVKHFLRSRTIVESKFDVCSCLSHHCRDVFSVVLLCMIVSFIFAEHSFNHEKSEKNAETVIEIDR